MIKGLGLRAKICGLARCVTGDIDACLKADVDRAHIFIATSDVHLKYKLRIDEAQALKQAVETADYVKAHGLECEFSCEDATRTPIDRLIKFYTSVESHGADMHNVPDTVGVMEPEAMQALIGVLCSRLKKPVSMHCHNDFGMAVANTLAGIKQGHPRCTSRLMGLGRGQVMRASNRLRPHGGDVWRKDGNKAQHAQGRIETRREGEHDQAYAHYPIVGDNAFAHEAGIHVHGVLAKAESYEPFTPEMVGQKRRIVMGKHTGKHAVSNFIKEKYNLSNDQITEVVEKVRCHTINKKKITEDDVTTIVESVLGSMSEEDRLVRLNEILVVTGNKITPTASVQLTANDAKKVAAGVGTGPVDALSKAIQSALGEEIKLLNYRLEAISGGTDSLCTSRSRSRTTRAGPPQEWQSAGT
jgi:isopropylmalate/homocitrate/citramalate synthase